METSTVCFNCKKETGTLIPRCSHCGKAWWDIEAAVRENAEMKRVPEPYVAPVDENKKWEHILIGFFFGILFLAITAGCIQSNSGNNYGGDSFPSQEYP